MKHQLVEVQQAHTVGDVQRFLAVLPATMPLDLGEGEALELRRWLDASSGGQALEVGIADVNFLSAGPFIDNSVTEQQGDFFNEKAQV